MIHRSNTAGPSPGLATRYRRGMRHPSDDPDELIVRCLENPDTVIRFYDRLPDPYSAEFSVELRAEGIDARFGSVSGPDEAGLPGFVAGLAGDFEGWAGQRSWSCSRLSVSASYHSRGQVALRWTLQQRLIPADGWSASVTTWVQAGAQMERVAGDLGRFLSR
jgi:hypothetical protein